MPNKPEVLLVTHDAQLRDVVQRLQPADVGLRYAAPEDLEHEPAGTPIEAWVDLDCSLGRDLPTVARRVYFHSPNCLPPANLPAGLFIRKPCTEMVAHVLWSGVQTRAVVGMAAADEEAPTALPSWITEFHELSLRELCRKCVGRLPARLGYAEVSLYLHDEQAGVLTLAETTYTQPIDVVVNMTDEDDNLMVSVARTGGLMRTDDVARERRARGLEQGTVWEHHRDGACLIAPLMSAGRLWGVLNFSGAEPNAVVEADLPLEVIFAFIGRALQHARAYDQARTEARVDVLTGLFNQRWISESLGKEIRRSQRFATPLALIVADLDGLKAVNDHAGHSAGDQVLRHVASRISSALRQFDSAARVGGDEFAILLPATDLEGARHVGRRIIQAIRDDAAVFRGTTLPVRASLGVVQWQAGWDAARLTEAADQAMYAAKNRGRNQLVCVPHNVTPAATPSDGSTHKLWPAPRGVAPGALDAIATRACPAGPADRIAGI